MELTYDLSPKMHENGRSFYRCTNYMTPHAVLYWQDPDEAEYGICLFLVVSDFLTTSSVLNHASFSASSHSDHISSI